MPFTEEQTIFVTTHLGIEMPEGALLSPAEEALARAQSDWNSALSEVLPAAVGLARQLRADPDPIGAEMADFVAECVARIKTPVTDLAKAEALAAYLSDHEDVDILEAENPYGQIAVRVPLLEALGPLRAALAQP